MAAASRTRSEGARRLSRVVATQDAIARALGVRQAAVSYWTTGRSVPNAENRALLEKLYGVPASAWKRPGVEAAPFSVEAA